jgi:hypothetical protein
MGGELQEVGNEQKWAKMLKNERCAFRDVFRCSKNVARGCKRVKMSDKRRKRVQKVENGCEIGVGGWDGCVGSKMSAGL